MTTTTVRATVTAVELEAILAPRHGVIGECRIDQFEPAEARGPRTVSFAQAEGPLRSYRRSVTYAADGRGQVDLTQQVRLQVGIPGFSWLFAYPLRAHTARIGALGNSPWWAPPARLPRRSAVVLSTLCLLTVTVGYLSSLLADTLTYAAADFHAGRGAQGVALGVVEAGAVTALLLLHLADRHGRRPVLRWALLASAATSAMTALAPSLVVLTILQLVSASLVGAGYVIIAVMAVEEMPAGARAWAVGVIGMSFGLGSGITLAVLPLAGVGHSGWRWPYAISVVGIVAVLAAARKLPESLRWVNQPAVDASPRRGLSATGRRRLLILGAGGLLLAVFASPASQFQNEFLHTERHLSATRISLLEQLSGTIGGLGTLIGGRLADTWGRRPVAAIGVAAGTAVTLAHYLSGGVLLWVWNTLGSVISYGLAPALAVYGAELFPTSMRARAGGVLTVAAAGGGTAGLVAGGALATSFGTIAPALAILAVAPLVVVGLIVTVYPETAKVTLEELNADEQGSAEESVNCG